MGVVGFLVDAGVLLALLKTLGPYWGRLISFSTAVLVTWALNRSITFSTTKKYYGRLREFSRYFLAMIGGGTTNYVLYAILVFSVSPVQSWPILGVAAGSIVGLAVNFTLARWWVFKTPPAA